MFTFKTYNSPEIYKAISEPSTDYTTWVSRIKDKNTSYVDPSTGNTFLHLATHLNDGKHLQSLLQKKLSPDILNFKNKEGNTPFVECLLNGNRNIISSFFKREGAVLTILVDPTIENAKGMNGLHAYCLNMDKNFRDSTLFDNAMVTRFKQSDKLNSQTILRKTPLMILCESEFIDTSLLRELMTQGASLNIQDSNGNTALMMLCKRDDIINVNIGIIQDMMNNVNNINIQNNEGNTVLHIACKNPNMVPRIVKLLLTHTQIKPLLTNTKGETPSSTNLSIQQMLTIAKLPTSKIGGTRRKRRKINRTRRLKFKKYKAGIEPKLV